MWDFWPGIWQGCLYLITDRDLTSNNETLGKRLFSAFYGNFYIAATVVLGNEGSGHVKFGITI